MLDPRREFRLILDECSLFQQPLPVLVNDVAGVTVLRLPLTVNFSKSPIRRAKCFQLLIVSKRRMG